MRLRSLLLAAMAMLLLFWALFVLSLILGNQVMCGAIGCVP